MKLKISGDAIVWTITILFVVVFLIIGIVSCNSEIEELASERALQYERMHHVYAEIIRVDPAFNIFGATRGFRAVCKYVEDGQALIFISDTIRGATNPLGIFFELGDNVPVGYDPDDVDFYIVYISW